ncbi:MAG: sulfotransferase [Flavobacteriales bacterium]|nr:sulfotransferase [Flavobacteriales bacterium]
MLNIKLKKLQRIDLTDLAAVLISSLLGWALRYFEGTLMKKAQCQQNTEGYSPIFIIGAPRSGTTILYQLITNNFDISYIDNIVHCLYRYPLVGLKVSRFLFKNKPHNIFKSDLGRTYMYSWRGPSECGKFWNQWFLEGQENMNLQSKEMAPTINNMMLQEQKSIVFKNTQMSLRLKTINKLWPNAKIIHLKRNPLFNTQSILQARMTQYNDISKWLSVKPKNINELVKLSPSQQVVHQVFEIEKAIEADKKLFTTYNWLSIDYEELCTRSDDAINVIGTFIDKKPSEHSRIKKIDLRLNNHIKLDSDTISNLRQEISKLNWKTKG